MTKPLIGAHVKQDDPLDMAAATNADLHGDVGTAVAESERLLEEMVTGPDFAEGVAALQAKRKPDF